MWLNSTYRKIGGTGTVVQVETTMDFLGTVYKRVKIFTTLLSRLLEHLGVMYRGFLENKYNKLWLRWKETSTEQENKEDQGWEEVRVKPIKI